MCDRGGWLGGRNPYLATLLLSLVLTNSASAVQYAELDLDNVLGNGPDQVSVSLGDTVEVSLWYYGGDPLFGFTTTICNIGGELDYINVEYQVPSTWGEPPAQFPSPGCVYIASGGGLMLSIPQPAVVAKTYWKAAVDNAMALIDVDDNNSTWFNTSFLSGSIDSSTGVAVVIGTPTSVEQSSWSRIKTLFR